MAMLLGVLVWAVTIMMCFFMLGSDYQMPEGISTVSGTIDAQYLRTLVVAGIAFVAAQAVLGWFIIKYRDTGDRPAKYVHGNNALELGGLVVTFVAFVTLGIFGQSVWAKVHLEEPPANVLKIAVLGQQFAWNIRYPGPDGTFGSTDPQFYDDSDNPMGLDPNDPAGKDDIITINEMAVPVNQPVQLLLNSKDVIHNFNLNRIRVKQDAVPGLTIPLQFTATKTGTYPVYCAEVCGLGHYRMRATLAVLEQPEYEAWLAEMSEE